MSKRILVLLMFLSVSLFAGSIPQTIPVQGTVTDKSGVLLNGNYEMVFTLFDAQKDGNLIWTETHSTVEVKNGFFSETIGSDTPVAFTDIFDNDNLWLEISVNSDKLSRIKIGSAFYSYRAQSAETLGGKSASEIIDSIPASTAVETEFDNTGTDLTGTNVDTVLKELLTRLKALETKTAEQDTKITALETKTGSLETDLTAAKTEISDQDAIITDHETRILALESDVTILTANLETTQNLVDSHTTLIADNSSAITALDTKTASMSLVTDTETGKPTVRFSGVNVQVVSGSGNTDGSINGTGNLIVGYNELRGSGDDRTGSHNIIAGAWNSYSSYGGFVAGNSNAILNSFASVTGGDMNTASGFLSTVSGGSGNTASMSFSSVSGGTGNDASGFYSSISGGSGNTASGSYATVAGGQNKSASTNYAAICGEYDAAISTLNTTVSGHTTSINTLNTTVSGNTTSINALNTKTTGMSYIASEGTTAMPTIRFSGVNVQIVSGNGRTDGAINGTGNLIVGYNELRYTDDNIKTGSHNIVSGGFNNYSSYGGFVAGYVNTIAGTYSSVISGYRNIASGDYSAIVGGQQNSAPGAYSSIGGGWGNTAAGTASTVSGGSDRTASNVTNWVAGGLSQNN